MKKIKEFMNKPMTWGGYAKFTVITCAISMIATVGTYGFIFRDQIVDMFDDINEKFHVKR